MLFLSWSTPRSQVLAEALYEFLWLVLRPLQPWISSKDIPAGAIWAAEIQKGLERADFGVVCLTVENGAKPWLNFEAGNLFSKKLCAVYFLGPSDFHVPTELPLATKQHVRADKAGTWKLVKDLNEKILDRMPEYLLRNSFETYWPSLERKIAELMGNRRDEESHPTHVPNEFVESSHRSEAALSPVDESKTPIGGSETEEGSLAERQSRFFQFLQEQGRREFKYLPNPLAIKA